MSGSNPNSPKNRGTRSLSVSHHHSHYPTVNNAPTHSDKAPSPPYWATNWQYTLPFRSDLEVNSHGRDDKRSHNQPHPTWISNLKCQNGSDACVTAPLPTPPYETPISLAPAPRSAPIFSSEKQKSSYQQLGNGGSLPPSPPWHFCDRSVNSSPRLRSSSTFSQGTISIPGTMSSRDTQPQAELQPDAPPSKEEANTCDKVVVEHRCSKCEAKHASAFKTRFTTAVKDFFKRPTIDESKFERIEGRHWSE